MMTFERQLSFKSVAIFMQPMNEIVGQRFRMLVKALQTNAQNQGVITDSTPLDWVIWLLDRMDDLPPIEGPANVLYRDWKP